MMLPDVMYYRIRFYIYMYSDAGLILLSAAPMLDLNGTIVDQSVFMDFGLVSGTTNETFPIKYTGLPVFLSNETEPVMMPFVTTTEVTPGMP